MSAQTQTQTQFKPVKIEIPVSEEPLFKAINIEWAVMKMAEIAGYKFVSRESVSFPCRYYRLTMIKIAKNLEWIMVHTHINKVMVCKKDKCVEMDVNDPDSIYRGLWDIAELLGYEEYDTINADPESEGVELHGYNKKVQIWSNCEYDGNKCETYEILVIIEESEE